MAAKKPKKSQAAAKRPSKATKRPAKAAAKRPSKATKRPAKAAAKRPSKAAAKRRPAAKPASGASLVGRQMPGFELVDQSGSLVASGALAGKPYVLYFYPKDDTPGCTREACDFRDGFALFLRAGVRVIGVSPDSQASHDRFAKKYSLPFTLLSDGDRRLAQSLRVWVKKQNYGREYMGIERSTFLVDAQGKIRRVWRGVKVDGHADAVLAAVRELG